jgi:hypothetical protein
MSMFGRRIWIATAIGALLAALSGFVLTYRYQASHPGALYVRTVDIKTSSGERLRGLFDGLPKSPRYDLKKAIESAPKVACGDQVKSSFWEKVMGAIGIAAVHAQTDGNCGDPAGEVCIGNYYTGILEYQCNCNANQTHPYAYKIRWAGIPIWVGKTPAHRTVWAQAVRVIRKPARLLLVV